MYNTTDSYKSKIYNVNHFLKIYINDAEIESRYIGDCKPSSTLFTNGEIELGSTPSQTVELQLYKTAVPDSITKIEIKSGITGEIVPIGMYNVDKISKVNDYTVSLTLSDNMTKFEFNYDGSKLVNNNNGKVKIIQVLQDICSKANVELGSTSFLNMNKEIAVYDNTVSARTYLSYIAEQAGGFAFIGRDGKLYIKSFKYALGQKIGEGKSIIIEKTNNLKAKTVIKGSHSQKTTEGRNLFNPKISTKTTFGVTVMQEGKHRIKLNGQGSGGWAVRFDTIHKFEKDKNYTVTIRKISGSVTQVSSYSKWGFLFYPESSNNTHATFKPSDTVINWTFKAEESNTAPYIWIGWNADSSVVGTNSVFNNLILEISIVEGTTAKDYEDYTGGKPSPSVDYQQEVETVGSNIQLLNNTAVTTTINGVDITVLEDKTVLLNGTATESVNIVLQKNILLDDGEDYTLNSGNANASSSKFGLYINQYYDNSNHIQASYNSPLNFAYNIKSKDTNSIYIYVNKGVTVENELLKPKLEKGSTASPYSMYNQGSIKITKRNKNQLSLPEQTGISNGVTHHFKDGTVTLQGTLTDTWTTAYSKRDFLLKAGTYIASLSKCDKEFEIRMYLENGKTQSFWLAKAFLRKPVTFEADVIACYMVYHHATKGEEVNISIDIQLEAGEKYSDFIIPKQEVFIVPTQQELLENDYINTTEHHEWHKLILTGAEPWYCETNGRFGYLVQNLPKAYKKTIQTSDLLGNVCNSYIEKTPSQTWTGTQGFCIDPSGSLRIWDDSYSKTSDLAGFKAMLAEKYNAGNPVVCYLKLATPIELELTDDQKNVLKEIHNMDLYEDYTIIESEAEMQVNFARAEISIRYFQNFEWGAKYKLSKIRYEDGIRVFEKGDDTGNTLYINPDNMFIVDQEQIDNIYDELKDLELYSFKGDSIVDPALDIGDIVVIDGKQVLYCGSSQYSGRWKASISSEIKSKERQETTTVKKPSQKTINRRVQSSIDQINGKIEQVVEENSEMSEKLSKHEQDINSIKDTVESMEDFTRETSSYQELHLVDTAEYAENLILTLKIYGDTEKWKELVPSTLLAPGLTVAPLGTTIDLIVDSQSRLNPSENKQVFKIRYGKKLRSLGNIRDELDIINNKVSVIRRIGLNDSGQEYVLEEEQTEELGELKLPTLKADTYIYVREYPNLEYFCRYITDNEYIKKFATQEGLQQATVELNTKIEQSNKEIILLARQKVGKDEIIASINLTPEKAKILAKLIELEGIVTANQNFKILLDGSMEAANGKFTGGKIKLEGGSADNPTFLIGTGSIQSFLTNDGFFADSGSGKAYFYVDDTDGRISILGNSGQAFIKPDKISTTGEMWATAYKYQSQAKLKENIVKFHGEALYMIKNSDIYEFNYKNNSKEKTIGLVIGDGYNTPQEIISNKKGINSYSMISISWKAIQEIDEKIEKIINILKKVPILGRMFAKRWENEKNNK